MKIFKAIKTYISSFFNDYSLPEELKVPIIPELSKTDGPTDIDMHNINLHGFPSKQSETITDNEIDDVLKELLSSHNISRLEKRIVLIDMIKDCLTLHGALIPLLNLNIKYSIDIVGGSVRDFLLDKHKEIKDLDILIKLQAHYDKVDYFQQNYVNNKLLKIKEITEAEWCTKEELEAVNFSDKDPLSEKHNKLVQLCLNRNHDVYSVKTFSKAERLLEKPSYGPDILKELSGMIKVDGDAFKYPVELLLTDQTREIFYKTIDFGLCNLGLKIIDITPDSYLDLISIDQVAKNFVISTDFCEDFKNKTLTYNQHNKYFDQIEYSFSNHLKRVSFKYPEYKVNINPNTEEEVKNNIEKVMLMDNLTETLDSNENKPIKVKRAKL